MVRNIPRCSVSRNPLPLAAISTDSIGDFLSLCFSLGLRLSPSALDTTNKHETLNRKKDRKKGRNINEKNRKTMEGKDKGMKSVRPPCCMTVLSCPHIPDGRPGRVQAPGFARPAQPHGTRVSWVAFGLAPSHLEGKLTAVSWVWGMWRK